MYTIAESLCFTPETYTACQLYFNKQDFFKVGDKTMLSYGISFLISTPPVTHCLLEFLLGRYWIAFLFISYFLPFDIVLFFWQVSPILAF